MKITNELLNRLIAEQMERLDEKKPIPIKINPDDKLADIKNTLGIRGKFNKGQLLNFISLDFMKSSLVKLISKFNEFLLSFPYLKNSYSLNKLLF